VRVCVCVCSLACVCHETLDARGSSSITRDVKMTARDRIAIGGVIASCPPPTPRRECIRDPTLIRSFPVAE